MRLEFLGLTDFRSYPAAQVELPSGPCAFVGANGVGKTNLIEAAGYVATLGSHRVAADAALVRLGAERAVVRAGIVRDDRRALVEIEIVPGRSNRVQLNRSVLSRPRQVLGVLSTVLFAPEDLAIVKGDPAERRRFLDDLLVALSPRIAAVRADYDRVLKQRNALLKSAVGGRGRFDEATLESWDAHLAGFGADLLAARLRLVGQLEPLAAKAYDEISAGNGAAGLAYRSCLPGEIDPAADRGTLQAALLAAMAANRRAELDRGLSLYGPHRDELVLSLGPLPARGYASHGECWSFALALRLASYELLRTSSGTDPVLILDDVFAELDAGRRGRLANLVGGAEQVLITAAVPDDVSVELVCALYDVLDGEVTRVR
jgi:DNA replication and repair protein RecF